MKLKVDSQGNAVLQDGHPVYIHDDGTESPFDAKATHVALATAKREAAESRTKFKEASDKLATFSGIEDPAAALKALQFAGSMEGKKVMDDEAIQKLISAAVKPLQEKLTAQEASAADLHKELYSERVSKQFATSQFINEKTVLPPDIAEATFGKHFKMENGKVIAVDASGNQIFSTTRAGEPANFEEAIVKLVTDYPLKDRILKASGQSGSGSQQSGGKGGSDDKPKSSLDKIKAGLEELKTQNT